MLHSTNNILGNSENKEDVFFSSIELFDEDDSKQSYKKGENLPYLNDDY